MEKQTPKLSKEEKLIANGYALKKNCNNSALAHDIKKRYHDAEYFSQVVKVDDVFKVYIKKR